MLEKYEIVKTLQNNWQRLSGLTELQRTMELNKLVEDFLEDQQKRIRGIVGPTAIDWDDPKDRISRGLDGDKG